MTAPETTVPADAIHEGSANAGHYRQPPKPALPGERAHPHEKCPSSGRHVPMKKRHMPPEACHGLIHPHAPLGAQDKVAGPQNPNGFKVLPAQSRARKGASPPSCTTKDSLCCTIHALLHGGIAASAQAAAWRSVFAAATMCCSAGITSAHCRVFRPQSGLTHRWPAGMRSAAFCISDTTCAASGMFGE